MSDEQVLGIAYDMPIVGYGGSTINTLRLWSAKATDEFNFKSLTKGLYQAVRSKILAENLSRVLYPTIPSIWEKEPRLKQQYFFVACSLPILSSASEGKGAVEQVPQLRCYPTQRHPPLLAIPELMRILIDLEHLEWDEAWILPSRRWGIPTTP